MQFVFKKVKYTLLMRYSLSLIMLLNTGVIFSQTREIDSLQNVLKYSKEDTNKVNSLCQLARYMINTSKIENAIKLADEAMVLSKKLNYLAGVGGVYMIKGSANAQTDSSTALKFFDSAFVFDQQVLKNGNRVDRGRAKKTNAWVYNYRGLLYKRHGHYTQSIKDLNLSIQLFKDLGDNKGALTASRNLAYTYSAQGNDIESLNILHQALILAQSINDKQQMLYIYIGLGGIYDNQGNKAEALKNDYQALKIAESINNKEQMIELIISIAASYYFQENYTEGLKNLFEALKLAKETGNMLLIARLYTNIGDYYQTSNKQEGLQAFNEAFKLFSKLNIEQRKSNILLEAAIYNGMGEIYELIGDSLLLASKHADAIKKYSEAVEKHKMAFRLRDETCDECASESLMNLGSLMMKLKQYRESRKYLTQGLQRAINKKPTYILNIAKRAYQAMAKLDSLEGNYRSALGNYKQYIIYRDSMTNDVSAVKNMELRLQYDFGKKEDSLKQKQILTQTKLDSQKKQKNFYLAGAGMLALLSVFVFLNFRNQKKINRLTSDAHAKEKAELELQSLRAQLNPHFMFNSLNAIQELILLEENEKSQSYLARFAKLLRLLLENADKPFIALQREIDFLQLYLSLENLRIPDLRFSITVDPNINPETTQIPNMILQPYIENAIWHGLSHKEKDKRLQIRINNEDGFTKYEMEDNGVGRKKSAELKSLYRKEHKSKGMELLSKRFRLLAKEYGAEVETTITDVVGGKESGTIVTIKVPNKIKSI